MATARIKQLGVTSERRYLRLPNVPTISETFEQFKIISYIGLMLPKEYVEAGDRYLEQSIKPDLQRNRCTWQGMIALGGAGRFQAPD